MDYLFLTRRRDGAVEYVTLNRPEARNAFNDTVIKEITHWAAELAQAGPDVRAAVIAGAGTTFCAGADAAWMARTIQDTEADNVREAATMAKMYAALDDLPMPLIGRVQGAALGGGVGLVSVCDSVVAEARAVFGFTEVRLGLVPATISPFVLAKIGRSAARDLFLTGARFSATRAKEIGLVHDVVPPDALDSRVAEVVGDVLAAGPEAVAAAKRLIRDVWGRPAKDVATMTAETIAKHRTSAEGQEGLAAFLDKRKPSWQL